MHSHLGYQHLPDYEEREDKVKQTDSTSSWQDDVGSYQQQLDTCPFILLRCTVIGAPHNHGANRGEALPESKKLIKWARL